MHPCPVHARQPPQESEPQSSAADHNPECHQPESCTKPQPNPLKPVPRPMIQALDESQKADDELARQRQKEEASGEHSDVEALIFRVWGSKAQSQSFGFKVRASVVTQTSTLQ